MRSSERYFESFYQSEADNADNNESCLLLKLDVTTLNPAGCKGFYRIECLSKLFEVLCGLGFARISLFVCGFHTIVRKCAVW